MRLTFTKRPGKADELLIERPGVLPDIIECPKQGILPHDLVHYAVESTLRTRGFLSLLADGEAASFGTTGGDAEEAVERLVEVFQAEMWGGRVSADELIGTYTHACSARGHAATPVSPATIEAIRARLDKLARAWAQLPLNSSLSFEF